MMAGQVNPEDQSKLYQDFIVRAKHKRSSLAVFVESVDRVLLAAPLTLEVQANCSCGRFFEQHPTTIEDTDDERLEHFLQIFVQGFCKCFKSNPVAERGQRFSTGPGQWLSRKSWLHVAAALGCQELVEVLIQRGGLDVNETTSLCQYTPLSLAVMQTKGDLVAWLCSRPDINVNLKSKTARHTPLLDAMLADKFHIVDILIKTPGIDVNASNFRGETPLIIAVRMNNARLVKQLLQAGADYQLSTPDGKLPLHLSVRSSLQVVKEFIEAKVPLNSLNCNGESAVTLAVRHRALNILDLLLWAGADPRANPQLPALVLAADLDHVRTVAYLLQLGEDPNQTDHNGWTALHFASMRGSAMIVELLLYYNASPNLTTSGQATPLSLATFYRHRAVTELLLSHGCEVNTLDQDLDSPLHFAAFHGDEELVHSLVERGAQVCLYNRIGATPLFNAVMSSNVEVIKYLLPYFTDLDLQVSSQGYTYVTLNSKASLKYPVPRSVLWVAAEQGNVTAVSLLLYAGFKAGSELWIQNDDLPEAALSNYGLALKQLLLENATNPPALVSLCRCVVRRALGPGKQRLVNQLYTIPRKIKNYISLREF